MSFRDFYDAICVYSLVERNVAGSALGLFYLYQPSSYSEALVGAGREIPIEFDQSFVHMLWRREVRQVYFSTTRCNRPN